MLKYSVKNDKLLYRRYIGLQSDELLYSGHIRVMNCNIVARYKITNSRTFILVKHDVGGQNRHGLQFRSPFITSTSKEPVCPRVELIFKIIFILLIIFLGFIKSKPC